MVTAVAIIPVREAVPGALRAAVLVSHTLGAPSHPFHTLAVRRCETSSHLLKTTLPTPPEGGKARFELWGGSRAQTLQYQTALHLCEFNTARVCVRKGWKILLDGSLSNSSKPSRTSSPCVLKGTLGSG